jgi:cell division protein FtsA
MVELAEQVLQLPVRQGLPCRIQGLSDELSHPVYATAIGLAMLDARQTETARKTPGKSSSSWFVDRFLSWVGN